MKFCPVCQTRFDDEILRFCTNDGAPLVEENPSFTEMPSDNAEDIGEETVIRRNSPPAPTVQISGAQPINPTQRIVVPTNEPEVEPVRAKPPTVVVKPVRKSNTSLVVLATILGTFAVVSVLGGVWYFLSGRDKEDSNRNISVNTNPPVVNLSVNANLNQQNSAANFNFNANANENINANFNSNFNLKTPTPTRTPTPTPTATPANVNSIANLNLGNTNVMSRPTVTPTATPTPTPQVSPSATATQTPAQNVNAGVMNSRAVSLTKPAYPESAKQVNASGEVRVQIAVDELGNVTSAKAVSGNRLLWSPAENAARQSRFNPIKVGDRAVPAVGIVVYNFINQ